MVNNRKIQTERGNEGLNVVAKYFEGKEGSLSVSLHIPNYSTGQFGKPDIIFRDQGIEVKRVEFLCKHRFTHEDVSKEEVFYAHLGCIHLNKISWDSLRKWCTENGKTPFLIAVLTFNRAVPILVRYTEKQVEEYREKHSTAIEWLDINCWELLVNGEMLK